MKLSEKQKVGQRILANNTKLSHEKILLLYTPTAATATGAKPTIIVSVPKKIVPKAVARNYIKRVLRALLRISLTKETLKAYDWMWICKAPAITKETRLQLNELIKHTFNDTAHDKNSS
jgi:ribonuclease P protein component